MSAVALEEEGIQGYQVENEMRDEKNLRAPARRGFVLSARHDQWHLRNSGPPGAYSWLDADTQITVHSAARWRGQP